MKSFKFWVAVLILGVVGNVLNLLSRPLWGLMGSMTNILNTAVNPPLYVLANFAGAFVFAWFYDKVYSSFGGGVKGGAMFGTYAGVFLNFPLWIFVHLMFKDFPYVLTWIWMGFGIVSCIIWGAVLGAAYTKA